MLVLSRKKGQSIIISDDIEITVLEVDGEVIKIGIAAPKSVKILRKELLASILESNREAAEGTIDMHVMSEQIKKIRKNF